MDILDPNYLTEKLDMFHSLKCAAKLNVALGFLPKDVEDRSCRWYCAHENNTLLERSKLVGTAEDLTKIKNLLSNTNFIESCTRQRANTVLKFYKLTNVTLFAALLQEVLMGRIDTVLPDPLLKNHSFKCFTFEESTRKLYNDHSCLYRALALYLP